MTKLQKLKQIELCYYVHKKERKTWLKTIFKRMHWWSTLFIWKFLKLKEECCKQSVLKHFLSDVSLQIHLALVSLNFWLLGMGPWSSLSDVNWPKSNPQRGIERTASKDSCFVLKAQWGERHTSVGESCNIALEGGAVAQNQLQSKTSTFQSNGHG